MIYAYVSKEIKKGIALMPRLTNTLRYAYLAFCASSMLTFQMAGPVT